jgi:hypothetical protein
MVHKDQTSSKNGDKDHKEKTNEPQQQQLGGFKSHPQTAQIIFNTFDQAHPLLFCNIIFDQTRPMVNKLFYQPPMCRPVDLRKLNGNLRQITYITFKTLKNLK